MAAKMRGSRTGRLAQMSGLAGEQAARQVATRTVNLVRTDPRAKAALAARQAHMAERLVIVLGSMRGAAMKIGQMLSLLDGGLVSPEVREEFQHKLAALHANAPEVPWKKMRRHLESELGQGLATAFSEFDRKAVAAASIGQVYRARLHDGREVAVKVQYPGIESAVRADLRNMALFLSIWGRFMHEGLDAQGLAQEMHDRIIEELDYEREAANTRLFSTGYRGHPYIVIPDVVRELSTRRVLVTEWIAGKPLNSAYDAPVAERNRIAEILFRFYAGTPVLQNLFSGDPHPGNCLVKADGSIAFLDFGLIKQVSPDAAAAELESLRAVAAGDGARLVKVLRERGYIAGREIPAEQDMLNAILRIVGWYIRDAEITIGPDLATEAVAELGDPHTRLGAMSRKQNVPAEHAMRARAEVQLLGVLGKLRPRLNFSRIAAEWVYGAEPVTELGRRHRAWMEEGGPAGTDR